MAPPTGSRASGKICFQFRDTGSCHYGSACQYSHASSSRHQPATASRGNRKSSQICHHFRNHGSCRNGDNCRFSHEIPPDDGSVQAAGPSRLEPNSPESKQARTISLQFGGLCELNEASKSALRRRQFYTHALTLLDCNDDGIIQDTVVRLASDGGLSFIRQSVLSLESISIGTALSSQSILTGEISPMLKILSHSRVTDSAVLEMKMETLYTFFIGPAGQRMAAVVDFVLAFLTDKWDVSLAESSLQTLAKVIDYNTANLVNERLRNFVSSIDQLLSNNGSGADSFMQFQLEKALNYLKLRLGIGNAIPSIPTIGVVAARNHRATFTLTRDLPGALSKDGPRHDNDHQDISEIRILPTIDEISSPRDDYLPTTDPTEGHETGIRWLIDRHFRLLRKDTVGQLTNAVHAELNRIRGDMALSSSPRNSVRTLAYTHAYVEDIRFDDSKGLELAMSFPQPAAARGLGSKKLEEWWRSSKRLQPGALVCVLNPYGRGTVLFCSVADYDAKPPRAQSERHNSQPSTEQPQPILWADKERAIVPLNLVEPDKNNIGRVVRWFRYAGQDHGKVLVEFPGVLLASFNSTLETLQDIFRSPRLPFMDILAPMSGSSTINPGLPRYAQKRGFAFDLSSITTTKTPLKFDPSGDFDTQTLQKNTTLDHSQAVAILDSLRQSVALIEGPPGTGKSFTGEMLVKVLLSNKKIANLGPILVVCYTNHALDQMLEHLYRGGVTRIARIGSRSKSEILENVNLRVIAKGAERTKPERDIIKKAREDIESTRSAIGTLMAELRNCDLPAVLKDYLERTNPFYFRAFFTSKADEDGFVQKSGKPGQNLRKWLQGGSRDSGLIRTAEELEQAPMSTMTHRERAALHVHWKKGIRDEITGKLLSAHKRWQDAKAEVDRVYREVDARCLAQADVIGVTTTGLARNVRLLRKANSKVLLCEEAGEVLEAHILTALLPSIEHAILIGDHLQLRPQIQNYDLQSTNPSGQKYSLDVSLFERLVSPFMDDEPRIRYSILQTQRRMHPSISRLIREPLYPELEDVESVYAYPPVTGVKKRLFWLHHEHEEQGKNHQDPTSTSVSNEWEADMTVALVTHLIRQGAYSEGDIAVVVPYLKQLRILRHRFSSQLEIMLNDRDTNDLEEAVAIEGQASQEKSVTHIADRPWAQAAKASLSKAIRLATVDNFQGEEAKVVVISLVRSNPDNKPGFLRISNRINVLLSRAKHGMYIIGNANTAGTVDMWAQVLAILKSEDNFGTYLELECPRHPNTPLLVNEPDHFAQFAPDGGCHRPCDKRLDCGHACLGRCHSDLLHGVFECLEPCPRPKRGCDHPCPRRCGQKCEKECWTQLEGLDIILSCGHHVSTARCWEAQQPKAIVCQAITVKTVPGCGHFVSVPCDYRVDTPTFKCPSACSAILPCGHACKRQCHECRTKEMGVVREESHGSCLQVCGRNYTTCKHSCRLGCHEGTDCQPCRTNCDIRCSHSICGKACYEPCAVCAEIDCASRCPHSRCSMPCAAPCDWIPCPRRCDNMLECGHQCPSLCGEICPESKYCQKCGSAEILAAMVDLVEMREFHEINLDEEPCLFLPCGHIFTAATLDGQMELSEYYHISPNGHPTAIRSSSEPFSVERVKLCPHCRGSLRNIARYGRIIRRALLDETTKKFITWSNAEFAKLGSLFFYQKAYIDGLAIGDLHQTVGRAGQLKISGNPEEVVKVIADWVGCHYFTKMIMYRRDVYNYAQRVQREEQPFQRVADFVTYARRQRKDTGQFTFDESVIQLKGELQARALLLRCDMFILSKFMELRRGAREHATEISLDMAAHKSDCAKLVQLAEKSIHPREMVEGSIFLAQCHALERGMLSVTANEGTQHQREMLKASAEHSINDARAVMERYPNLTSFLQPELDATMAMLRDEVFYQSVTDDEIRTVYKAMNFSTGHWYTCANGHPFTIADCGMPMEEATCPECGARVGGQDHQAVEGVQRAVAIEAIGTGMEGLNLWM